MTALSMLILPLGVIGPWQWVIIALVILLLFGGRKIPELMRGLGKGVKEFKTGMKDAEKEINEIKSDIEKEEPKKEE
jgi:sec-independent protein translocase protein TatA